MGLLLAVQLRGTVNVSEPVGQTLRELRLGTRFRASLIPDSPSCRGMLGRVRTYVAWTPVERQLLRKLLATRARRTDGRPLQNADLLALGFRDLDQLVEALMSEKVRFAHVRGLKPSFALGPPRGGFKRSTRLPARAGGVLGENPLLGPLVERMLPVGHDGRTDAA
jgi:large subunit ribosomal protein L30